MMTGGPTEVALEVPVPGSGTSQILYAAAFIDPAVRSVSVQGDRWVFALADPVPAERLERGLNALIERFGNIEVRTEEPVFALSREDGAAAPTPPELAGIVQEVHPGLFVYREPASTLIRFLDAAVLARFARPFEAAEEIYPNCIPIQSLAQAHHLSSFPEHLHFLTHLREDLEVLDDFSNRARDGDPCPVPGPREVSPIALVQNPSTCYHCYAARANSDIGGDRAITAITRCHRFEAANHQQFGRLLEFSLREVIFLGSPDYARQTRATTLELVETLASDWCLYGELAAANDPFFTSDYAFKAAQQQRLALKYEYRMTIPGQDAKLAVMSSNLHGPTFSKAFNIKRDGRVINTGCLGFGLERLALAILHQHGIEPVQWPERLARDYRSWLDGDPLWR